MTVEDSPMITRSRGIERWFPIFARCTAGNKRRVPWHSSKTMVTRARNSGCHSDDDRNESASGGWQAPLY
jgi:hypothetical protein